MPDAAIIIPHYNDVTRLTRCLEALLPQLSDRTELVVVDNASTDDLAGVKNSFPAARFVTEPLKGAAAARNRGVVETSAPLIFFIDADCVPEPDWVQNAFAVSDTGDLVGGAVTVFDETPSPRAGAEAFETVFAFNNQGYIENKGFSVTANLLTRRDVFEDVGPLDGSLSEDVEWCQRAVSKGYRLVYADALRVSHPSRSDWTALAKKWRRMTHEGFGVNGTDFKGRLSWAGKALMMPLSAVAHVPKVLRHQGLRDSQERLAALGTLFRLRLQRMIWMLQQAVMGHL